MAEPAQIDVLIYDVSGTNCGAIRRALRKKQSVRSETLAIDLGVWCDRSVVIGSPRRVIGMARATTQKSIGVLLGAHRPAGLIVVGNAAAACDRFAVGDIVLAESVLRGVPHWSEQVSLRDMLSGRDWSVTDAGLAVGVIGTGPFDRDSETPDVVTGWFAAALQAAIDGRVPAAFLAMVTVVADPALDTVKPPDSVRSFSRDAGAWLGRLVAGQKPGSPRKAGFEETTRSAVQKLLPH